MLGEYNDIHPILKVKEGGWILLDNEKYIYAEFRCPLCEHQFVTRILGSTYALKGSDAEFTITTCPACGTDLFISKQFKYGVIKEFVPVDDVKLCTLRF